MALSGYEPAPMADPPTERVRGGRRAAIAVAVVAIVVVGTFIWKPWEGGPVAAPSTHPIGTTAAIAAPITAPPTTTAGATPTPSTEPTTPVFYSTPGQIEAPMNLGFVSLPPDDQGTFVYCVYGRAANSSGLITMIVNPPVVVMGVAARGLVEIVQFRPEIEVNSLEGVFSSDWSALRNGRNQRSRVGRDLVALFKAQSVKVNVGNLPDSAVLRVAIALSWIGPDGERVADQRLYPAAYAPLGDAATDPIPEGCPARN